MLLFESCQCLPTLQYSISTVVAKLSIPFHPLWTRKDILPLLYGGEIGEFCYYQFIAFIYSPILCKRTSLLPPYQTNKQKIVPNYQHPSNHCGLVRHSVIGVWRRSRWDAGRGSSTDCSLPINFLLYDECNLIIMIQELWKWSRQMMPSGTIMMLMMILALTTFLWALGVLRGCNFKLNHIFCQRSKILTRTRLNYLLIQCFKTSIPLSWSHI